MSQINLALTIWQNAVHFTLSSAPSGDRSPRYLIRQHGALVAGNPVTARLLRSDVGSLDVLVAEALDFVLSLFLIEADPGGGHDLTSALTVGIEFHLKITERVVGGAPIVSRSSLEWSRAARATRKIATARRIFALCPSPSPLFSAWTARFPDSAPLFVRAANQKLGRCWHRQERAVIVKSNSLPRSPGEQLPLHFFSREK